MTDASITSLGERRPGDIVTIGGLIANITKKITRRGDIMVLVDVEDLAGASVEVVVFARTYEKYGALLRPDSIALIKGRVDKDARDDSTKMMAMEIHEPRLDERPFEIVMPVESCTPKLVTDLKDILANHPGQTQVLLHLDKGAETTVLRLGSEFSVDTSNGLHAELKAELGTRLSISAS